MIYFDHNASTPIAPSVLEAMLPFLQRFHANPSSLHKQGRIARTAIDTAREQVASALDAVNAQIIFTSSATEANALALSTLASGQTLALSAIEHPSVSAQADFLAKQGYDVIVLPVDSSGRVTESALAELSVKQPDLVSVMSANNETGVIQDMVAIANRVSNYSGLVHTDAVQAFGKIPLSFKQLGVNLMSVSGHKIYGPKGIGALIVDKTVALKPLFYGGGQELGVRSGTENVAAIVGFGEACRLAHQCLAERSQYLQRLRDELELGLMDLPGVTLFAQDVARLPNTSQFGIAGIDGEMLVMNLDRKNIAVSSASACASGGGEPSPVLLAMGVSPEQAKTAIRVSLGETNQMSDIVEFLSILKSLLA
ncbi:cysteine desulfurase family protein [Methylocucumis oryzae]|uniref:Cysteine desulfurase n=1 Tax=Methylocucumis oryzae TaxID=1632867 RepID=A0A0F3IH64_9GAMM|nr:cysteine desulfurase family protein [Methylocucumis oryzae]KJV06120.1 cysteine desulfurase [Methylocucumis oryzae]